MIRGRGRGRGMGSVRIRVRVRVRVRVTITVRVRTFFVGRTSSLVVSGFEARMVSLRVWGGGRDGGRNGRCSLAP